jgi:parallel beta-helix repeat protein
VETWLGIDDHKVIGNITIAPGGILIIDPDTIVYFDGPHYIYVDGTLNINGTKNQKVRIQSFATVPSSGDWGGIRVNNTGTVKIDYAIISHAANGIYLDQSQNCTINSTSVRLSKFSGIVCESTNNTMLANNSFFSNDDKGLELNSAENTTVEFNTINANSEGINVSGSKNNQFLNNSISNINNNVYDDGINNWHSNYYGDYQGVDTDKDFIGDTGSPADYFIPGGSNIDLIPKTKIHNSMNLKTYATITKHVEEATSAMTIFLPPDTQYAGSQTLDQHGYYYENIQIDAMTGNDVNILGPQNLGITSVFLDGRGGVGFDVQGNWKLNIGNFSIINCNIGVNLHSGANKCTIDNISFENNQIGVKLDNAKNNTIKKSSFIENQGTKGGLYIRNSQQTRVINNTLTNNYNGIMLTQSEDNLIFNNICKFNKHAGIRINESLNNTINYNLLESNIDAGLIFTNNSKYNTFFNNKYEVNKNGIEFYSSSNNYFKRSEIKGNPEIGIIFNSQSNNNLFLGIAANNFVGYTIGILSDNSINNTFQNCTVTSLLNRILDLNDNSSITFLNTKFSEPAIAFQDADSRLIVKYFLTVRTVNKTNYPISGASVEVYDNKTNLIVDGVTNSKGEIPLIPCISFIKNSTAKDYSFNDYLITANDTITEKIEYLNISTNPGTPKVFIKLFNFNYEPIFISDDNLTAIEKTYYSVRYDVLNFELDKNLTWELETNNSFWLHLNEATQSINGTPHNRDVGINWVTLTVRDIDGDADIRIFNITVINTKPEIQTQNQITIYEDEFYNVDYNSSDDDGYYNDTSEFVFPDNNLTTWRYLTDASWLKFDVESGILNGTPLNNHIGTYDVRVTVDDGHGSKSSTNFELTVINTPPEIITEDKLLAYKNVQYYNDYNSSDDGQGNIRWEMQSNASWLTINSENGTLNGTPGQDDVGWWLVNITVLDDHGGKTSRNFTLQVVDLNMAPVITEPLEDIKVAYVNQLYSIQYIAVDEDTPVENITWELGEDTNATWLNLDLETGELHGTPLIRHVGWYWVNVTCLDNDGGIAYRKFELNVTMLPNTPPSILNAQDEFLIEVTIKWLFDFEAEDDYTIVSDLNWSLSSNASWLKINSSSGEIEGTPSRSELGRFWVNVSVMDELGLVNFTNFTLIVRDKNHPPKLSASGMTPLNGSTNTEFTFYVIYSDPDGDAGSVFVYIDNKSYLMTPNGTNYWDGVNYTYKLKLKSGMHDFYFFAQDEWGLEAVYDENVPNKETPMATNDIEKIVYTPFYMEATCWIIALVIVIILLCILQFVLKPYSRKHDKILFIQKITLPDSINPVVRAQRSQEQAGSGELGYLCPSCKAVVDEDAKKCTSCGERFTEVEFLCPHCQADVGPEDLFCPKCGSQFEELPEDELEELELEEEEPEEEVPEEKEPEEEEPKVEEPGEEEPKKDVGLPEPKKGEKLPEQLPKAKELPPEKPVSKPEEEKKEKPKEKEKKEDKVAKDSEKIEPEKKPEVEKKDKEKKEVKEEPKKKKETAKEKDKKTDKKGKAKKKFGKGNKKEKKKGSLFGKKKI